MQLEEILLIKDMLAAGGQHREYWEVNKTGEDKWERAARRGASGREKLMKGPWDGAARRMQ